MISTIFASERFKDGVAIALCSVSIGTFVWCVIAQPAVAAAWVLLDVFLLLLFSSRQVELDT